MSMKLPVKIWYRLLITVAIISVSTALHLAQAVNEYVAPSASDFPPLFSGVELIEGSGNDGLGDHVATKDVNLNNFHLYGIGNNTLRPYGLTASSYLTGLAASIRSQDNTGLQVSSSATDTPALIVKNNMLGSGYALMASSTQGVAASFSGLLQLSSSSISEIPQLRWSGVGASTYNRLSVASTGLGNNPDLSLLYGNQWLCDITQPNCGRVLNTTGDDLGSHVATYNLDMRGLRVHNVSNGVYRLFTFQKLATTSLQALSSGTGEGWRSFSPATYGIVATTSLTNNSSFTTYREFTEASRFSPDAAVYRDKIYWGTKNEGFLADFFYQHGGLYPTDDWVKKNTASIAHANCAGLDLSPVALEVYRDKLYAILISDPSVAGHPITRLYTYDAATNVETCYRSTDLTLPSGFADFNSIAAMSVYRNKLYIGVGNATCDVLSSTNGTSWTKEFSFSTMSSPMTECRSTYRMMSRGDKLYFNFWTNRFGANPVQLYQYNGTTASSLQPPNIGTVGAFPYPNLGNGWVWYNDSLYVAGITNLIWKYENGAWSTITSAGMTPPTTANDGAWSMAVYENNLFLEMTGTPSLRFDLSSPSATWQAHNSHNSWMSTYRGALLSPDGGATVAGVASAAIGYNSGSGYGALGWSVAGPGARFYSGVRIDHDYDLGLEPQLTFGSDDNRLSIMSATSTASSNLYWGDKLLCNRSLPNCGWADSASSENIWKTNAQGDIYTHHLAGIALTDNQQQKLAIGMTGNEGLTVRTLNYSSVGSYSAMQIQGNRLYAVTNQGVKVVDITNPAAPTLLGTISTPFIGEVDDPSLEVSGNFAYLTLTNQRLLVLDISNPNTSTPNYFVMTIPGTTVWRAMALRNHTLFLGGYGSVLGDPTLFVIDVSNPFAPQLLHSSAVGSYIDDLAMQGRYLYIANRTQGLRIYDVQNPTAPISVGQYTSAGESMYLVRLQGNQAVLLSTGSGLPDFMKLRLIDIASPTSPQELSSRIFPPSAPEEMGWLGEYLYTVRSTPSGSDFITYRISESGIGILGFRDVASSAGFRGLAVSGTELYTQQYDGSPASVDLLYVLSGLGASTTNLSASKADIGSASILGALSTDNFYSLSGLSLQNGLTLSSGPLASGNGKIKIGNTILDKTLLDQLLVWLSS